MTIQSEIQKLNPSGRIELYELDLTPFGGDLLRFHSGKNFVKQDVVWQGNTYLSRNVTAKGFSKDGRGRVPRPVLTLSNVDGYISTLLRTLGEINNAVFTRRQTLIKFLDAENYKKINYLLWSETLTDASWVKSRASVVPYGVSSSGSPFYALIENTASSTTHLLHQTVPGIEAGATYRASLVCKALPAGQGRQLRMRIADSIGFIADIVIDLSSGEEITMPLPQREILDLGSGEYRISVEFVGRAGSSLLTLQAFLWNNGVASYTGDGVSGAQVTEFQLSYGTGQKQYQRTTSSHNPDADPTQEFPTEKWFLDRKSVEDRNIVEFELASPFDRPGTRLPARQIMVTCTAQYRSADCGYTGGPVADAFDVPTNDSLKDSCSHSINGCKFRYGADGELMFNGEPAAGFYRK